MFLHLCIFILSPKLRSSLHEVKKKMEKLRKCFATLMISIQFSDITAWFFFNWVGLPWWLSVKESTCQCRRRHGFDPWVGKIPWRKKSQPTSAFLPGKYHWQRSLVGYSPWVCKESDTTEGLNISNGKIYLLLREKHPDFLIEIDQM